MSSLQEPEGRYISTIPDALAKWATNADLLVMVRLLGGRVFSFLFRERKKQEQLPPEGPVVLLEEPSPNGACRAIVEHDHRSVYFYLMGPPDSPREMVGLWVRNLLDAPSFPEVGRMRDGLAPMNPARYCRRAGAGTLPEAKDLSVVWLPEGNGVALYERSRLLAIIPPWAGEGRFHGHSTEAVGQGPVAWELTDDNALVQRFEEAQQFWSYWDRLDAWTLIQKNLLETYERRFGEHVRYFKVDAESFPPMAVATFKDVDRTYILSLGMSVRPQPNVERATDNPRPLRRIELGAVVPASYTDEQVREVAEAIGSWPSHLWRAMTWFGPGHTLPFEAWRNPTFRHALLAPTVRTLEGPLALNLDDRFGDPVTLLWLLPVTLEEFARVRAVGGVATAKELPVDRCDQC